MPQRRVSTFVIKERKSKRATQYDNKLTFTWLKLIFYISTLRYLKIPIFSDFKKDTICWKLWSLTEFSSIEVFPTIPLAISESFSKLMLGGSSMFQGKCKTLHWLFLTIPSVDTVFTPNIWWDRMRGVMSPATLLTLESSTYIPINKDYKPHLEINTTSAQIQ